MAEEGLAASDHILQQLIDSIPGLVCTMTPQGEVALVNQQLLEFSGRTPAELRSWAFNDAVHPDDLPHVIAAFSQSVISERPYEIEHRCRRADGAYRWFHVRALPVRGEGDRIARWHVLLTDIDDRKQAEDVIRERERELSQIINTIPALAWSARNDGSAEFFNQRYLDYVGMSQEQMQDSGWTAAVHPDDLTALKGAWIQMMESGQGDEREVRLRRNDGTYRWFLFRTNPLRDEHGVIVKWFGVNTDIEDRKRADESLLASERSLRQIINTLPVTAWATDAGGYVEFLSDRWLDYAGFTAEQGAGLGWGAAIHPDDAPGLFAYWQGCLESGSPVDTEARMRRFDGEYRWFLFRANPLRDANGTIVKWYGTNIDIEDRKRADEALLASERSLRQIINTLPTTAWQTDARGYVEFLSDRWLDYAGFTAEQGAGLGWGSAIHPDDAPGLFAYWQSALNTGTPVDTEARMRRFDGEYRWFLFRASPMHDEHGTIVKWYGTNIDIEDRKRADEALAASEHNLKLIINTIPTAAWSARADGYADFLSDTYLNYAGVSSEKVEGWGWRDIMHPDDIDALEAHWRSSLETGAPVDTEARMRRFDGEYRWFLFRANPLRDANGAIVRWYGHNADIEDRKHAESLLAGETQLLAMVAQGRSLDEVLEALCRLVERNAPGALCSILSIDPDGRRFRHGAGPSLPGAYNEVLDGLIIDSNYGPCGLAAKSKMQAIAADVATDPRWQASPWPQLVVGHGLRACWSTPILSGDDEVIGVFALYQHEPATPTPLEEDLIRQFAHVASIAIERSQSDAELRRTDEALNQARTELAHVARVATLNAMAASIAHEVSQPLSGILSNASTCVRLLATDPPNVPSAAETARRTIRDANRATEVIKRLQAMFSSQAPTKEPLDLNDVAREVIALSAGELRRSGALIQSRFANDLPPVSADRVQLQQVILNLLLNAADAMSAIEDRPRVLLVATDVESDAGVKVTVRDSGTGIDPHNVAKLFEAFYTTKPDGMGVGLSICRSIIESHGGRVWAAPNDGPGATFGFSIPRFADS